MPSLRTSIAVAAPPIIASILFCISGGRFFICSWAFFASGLFICSCILAIIACMSAFVMT